MKYPKLKGICLKCLGCNQLELETFTGKYKCEHFVDGGKTNEIQVYNRHKIAKP